MSMEIFQLQFTRVIIIYHVEERNVKTASDLEDYKISSRLPIHCEVFSCNYRKTLSVFARLGFSESVYREICFGFGLSSFAPFSVLFLDDRAVSAAPPRIISIKRWLANRFPTGCRDVYRPMIIREINTGATGRS